MRLPFAGLFFFFKSIGYFKSRFSLMFWPFLRIFFTNHKINNKILYYLLLILKLGMPYIIEKITAKISF